MFMYIYIHWQYWHTHTHIQRYTCIHDAIIFQTHFSKHLHGLCYDVFLVAYALWGRCSFLPCFGGSHQPMALVESFRSLLLCWVGECNMAADSGLNGMRFHELGKFKMALRAMIHSHSMSLSCFFYYDFNTCLWFLMILEKNDGGAARVQGPEATVLYAAECFDFLDKTCLTKTICFDLFW